MAAYADTLDLSGSPSYPSATTGLTYLVAVPGRVGGVDGPWVNKGDVLTCLVTAAAGVHGTVGKSWSVTEATSLTALAADVYSAKLSEVAVEALSTDSLSLDSKLCGTATLTTATLVVATTAAAAASAILITPRVAYASYPVFVSDIVEGVSFTINGDPGRYSWMIVKTG
jgi:hypothetical protein